MDNVSRRTFLQTAAVALAVVQVGFPHVALAQIPERTRTKGTLMNAGLSVTPQGAGSVSRAPNLPDGLTDTFTSQYIDTGGLRLHAVIGGEGPPLLLIHGWPQTWYAWRLVMPALARDFQVVAVDQRGRGLSDKPHSGYDAGTEAK